MCKSFWENTCTDDAGSPTCATTIMIDDTGSPTSVSDISDVSKGKVSFIAREDVIALRIKDVKVNE